MISSGISGNELRKADSLFRAGKFPEATLEYERVYFHATDPGTRDLALLGKGDALKAVGDAADAADTYARIPLDGRTDSVIFRSGYNASLCYYLAGDQYGAEYQLLRMKEHIRDTNLLHQSLFLEVIVFTEGQKWESAKVAFESYCKYRKLDANAYSLITSEEELDLKSERKALWLSLLLPGLGQCYAGKWGKGFSSLVLTGAAVSYGVISALNGLWITTFFTGFTYTLRFYSGGARYAMASIRTANETKIRAYKNRIRDTLLSLEGAF